MRYTINENIDINRNRIILNDDNSFSSKNEGSQRWGFQVSLDQSRSLILNFNSNTHRCVSCEGRINQKSKKIKHIKINLSSPRKAALIFDSCRIPKYGIEDLLCDQTISYDKSNNIIVLGNYKVGEVIYEFGIGQFVKIYEGKISAVIIKLKDK